MSDATTTTNETITEEQELKTAKSKLKEIKKEKKETESEKEYATSYERWMKELPDIRLFYISDENKYYYWNDKNWITSLTKESVSLRFNIRSNIAFTAFFDVMRTLGRVKDRAVYSFFQDDNIVLNMANQELWLQPKQGEYNPIFDIILDTLSDGRQDIRDHLEQVIYWKWKHPETYKLPCPVIYGEGGLGKNEFVNRVLKTLFKGGNVRSLSSEMVVGDYTGQLLGNVITYVDELQGCTRKQMQKFKELVGNSTVNINNKGGKQVDIDATSLIITGGNSINGALLLDGTSSDRRWTIIHCRRNIVIHAMLACGEDISELEYLPFSEKRKEPAYKKFEKFVNDNIPFLSDESQVGAWLYSIEQKWQGLTDYPKAYHGEDYFHLLQAQKTTFETMCDTIFNSKQFSNISTMAFYEVYKRYMHENGSSYEKNHLLKRKEALLEAKEYINKAGYHVEYVSKGEGKQIYNNGKRRTFSGFKTLDWGKKPELQDCEFIDAGDNGYLFLSEWMYEIPELIDDKDKNDNNVAELFPKL